MKHFGSHPRGLVLLGVVCLAVALLSRGIFVLRAWDPDSAIFIYMGKLVCDGGRYWVDLVDNKLPTVGLLTSLPCRWFGDWWPGYVALQVTMAIGASLALARAAQTFAGDRAWWPTLLFAMVYLNFHMAVFGGFQLETIQIFFASLAAMGGASILRGLQRNSPGQFALDGLLVGLSAGVAAMAKPTAVAVVIALAVAMAAQVVASRGRTRWGAIACAAGAMAAGFALVGAVVLIYLVQTQTLIHMPAILSQIRTYAANSATDLRDMNKIIWALAAVGLPMAVRMWVGRHHNRIEPLEPHDSLEPNPGGAMLFAWCWLALELLSVILQKRMYGYHFLVLAAPAAMVFGMLPRRTTAKSIAMALAPAMLLSLLTAAQVWQHRKRFPNRLESSQWLAAHAHGGDRVWRDMAARLLIETDLAPGSRFPLTFIFINSDESPQRFWSAMHQDFEQRQPRWIVLPRDLHAHLQDYTSNVAELQRLPLRKERYLHAWEQIHAYIRMNYEPAAQLQREIIWQRKIPVTTARAQ
jgi:hypothetical protein